MKTVSFSLVGLVFFSYATYAQLPEPILSAQSERKQMECPLELKERAVKLEQETRADTAKMAVLESAIYLFNAQNKGADKPKTVEDMFNPVCYEDASAVPAANSESQIKVTMLNVFAKNMIWPGSDGKKKLCVYNMPTDFDGAVYKNNSIESVVSVAAADVAGAQCHIIYFPSAKTEEFRKARDVRRNLPPTVYVVDRLSLMEQGADVAMMSESGRIRYKLNKITLQSKGIAVNPSLVNQSF